MTSLTGGNAADNDIRKLMQQIIAERDAKFAPKKEGGEAAPTGGMFDKPAVKANDGDVITDLLGYLEQKRTEALDSYQSKVMRRSSKPLPKPEDIDVSSFLSEAGLSSQPEPLTFTSATAPALGEPELEQVADTSIIKPSKTTAKPVPEVAIEEPADTGNGLMSSPRSQARPESMTGLSDDAIYSAAVEDLYTDFTKGGQEGAEAHIGQDEQNITLPAGIVADGLKYDGKPVTQGSNTIKKAGFDKTKLDTSGAYKKVNGVKIKRSDYTSDVDFSKAVLEGFEDVAKTKAGTDWDSMPAAAKKAMLKVGWNKGEGWLKGSTAGAAYKELAKTNPSATALYPKILTGSTLAPKKDGTVQGASIGIAKARADAMNTLKDVLGANEITKVVADNSGTNTAFKYYDSAGTLVHTEQTDRAASLYANKMVEVEKNKKGVW